MLDHGTRHRSWTLFVASLAVMLRNKKLLLLPLASSLCVLLMFVLFSIIVLAPVTLAASQHPWFDLQHWEPLFRRWADVFSFNRNRLTPHIDKHDFTLFISGHGNVVRLVLCYALMMSMPVVAGLLNAALYHEAIRALAGECVSLRRGLQVAGRRSRPLLNWMIFSGVVVGLLPLAAGRFGFVGRIVGSLLGLSWAAASFFAIPILLREKSVAVDPLVLLRTSASLVKTTWGESVLGYVGFRILSLPVTIGGLLVFAGFRMFAPLPSSIIGATVVAIILLGLWSVLLRATDDIYRCALYIYATEGAVPGPFTEEQMNMAWNIRTPTGV